MKHTFVLGLLILSFGMHGCAKEENFAEQPAVESNPPHGVQMAEKSNELSSWILDGADIRFYSTKTDKNDNDIVEEGVFNTYFGYLDKQGNLKMEIELDSVETDISIRNQRIKEWLFETERFPKVEIQSQIDYDWINTLGVHKEVSKVQPLTISFHGKTIQTEASLKIIKLDNNTINVMTQEPIHLNLLELEMMQGLNSLTEVMNLKSIGYLVPVKFQGNFKKA